MNDVEADSGGETEAGTAQRDVVRLGVVNITVSFSVSPKWLKLLTGLKQKKKIQVKYFSGYPTTKKEIIQKANSYNFTSDLADKHAIDEESF